MQLQLQLNLNKLEHMYPLLSHASTRHSLMPPRVTFSCLHAPLSQASTHHYLMPPRVTLSCLHASLSHASTCHSLIPPRVALSFLHVSLSHASTRHSRMHPRVTLACIHVSLSHASTCHHTRAGVFDWDSIEDFVVGSRARLDHLYCARQITGVGMKRRDKEIMKQPSGDPSSGENPGIVL